MGHWQEDELHNRQRLPSFFKRKHTLAVSINTQPQHPSWLLYWEMVLAQTKTISHDLASFYRGIIRHCSLKTMKLRSPDPLPPVILSHIMLQLSTEPVLVTQESVHWSIELSVGYIVWSQWLSRLSDIGFWKHYLEIPQTEGCLHAMQLLYHFAMALSCLFESSWLYHPRLVIGYSWTQDI